MTQLDFSANRRSVIQPYDNPQERMFLQLVCKTEIERTGCLSGFNGDDFRLFDVGNVGIKEARVWGLRSRSGDIHSKQITTGGYFFDFVFPVSIGLAIKSLK